MLASTVQFSSNDQPPITPTPTARGSLGPAPKTRPYGRALRTQQRARPAGPTGHRAPRTQGCSTSDLRRPCVPNSQRSTHERTSTGQSPVSWPLTAVAVEVLLRKEVIQPHLPVRLPCYDFVPIAGPTFDSSLPQGVGPPASGVTDFRDVTGGVYKARERIHRSNADLRLLATPTSWGRVADPNPN